MSYFKVFDPATGALVMDETSAVFRLVGKQFIVGQSTGNPNLDGISGTIIDNGLTTGTPYCRTEFAGTVNNGGATSADPPAPNITYAGNAINYASLWGDWWFTYGVT